MCGRYALCGPVSRHRQHFGLQDDFDFADRYNIAPSQLSPVIRATRDGAREAIEAQWGLLPGWVKDPSKIAHPINAKAETAAEKPMFRTAFRRFRILVPANGFYEWMQRPSGKQPFFIRLRNETPIGFGGLLEHREDSNGMLYTYTILTTEPNEVCKPIHNRMPVIIAPENYEAWLDPTLTDPSRVKELITPYPAALMEAYPVSRAVGNPRSQGSDLIQPI